MHTAFSTARRPAIRGIGYASIAAWFASIPYEWSDDRAKAWCTASALLVVCYLVSRLWLDAR